MSEPKLSITALTPANLAAVLARASGQEITEALVREIAEEGDLLAQDGTINLIEYTAYLAQA